MQTTTEIPNCATLNTPDHFAYYMFSLSAHHYDEIAPFPELVKLVTNSTLENVDTDKFLRLCVVNKCVKTFLTLLPNTNYVTGPLTLLASLNAVEMAQHLDVSTDCPEPWIRAARRAAKAGHTEFVQYILTQTSTRKIREAAINGACMGDHVDMVKMLHPTITDEACLRHLPILAAQHNALSCMNYLLNGMSGRVWASALAAVVFQEDATMCNMMLECVPDDIEVTSEWAVKVALRGSSKLNDPHKLLRFVFEHIALKDITAVRPQMHPTVLQDMIEAYEYVVLTKAVGGQGGSRMRKL